MTTNDYESTNIALSKALYLSRNISVVRQSKIPCMKINLIFSAVTIKDFTNCHKQSHPSIVAFIGQSIYL